MIPVLQTLIGGILIGGLYGLISIGLTLIFGVVRIKNFAHGEYLMVAMFLVFFLFSYMGIDPYLSMLIVAPLMFVLGVISYKGLIKYVLFAPSMNQILVTLGLSFFLMNVFLLFFGADYLTVRTEFSTYVIRFAGLSIGGPRLMAFVFSILITVGLLAFLKYTYMGKAIRAVAMEKQGAMLMGINIDTIYSVAWGLGLGAVGIAAALMAPIYYTNPMIGQSFVLVAFIVVVLGGLGSLTGALLAGLLIGLVEAYSGLFIAVGLKEAVYFLIFIIVLAVKPSGLFGLGSGYEEVGLK